MSTYNRMMLTEKSDWDKHGQIETIDWETDSRGQYRSKGPRTIGAVADEIRSKLDKAKIAYEYVSTYGVDREQPWPEGETTVALELGGNEGYHLNIDVHTRRGSDFTGSRRVLWIKTLGDRAAALDLHAIMFQLLGS